MCVLCFVPGFRFKVCNGLFGICVGTPQANKHLINFSMLPVAALRALATPPLTVLDLTDAGVDDLHAIVLARAHRSYREFVFC